MGPGSGSPSRTSTASLARAFVRLWVERYTTGHAAAGGPQLIGVRGAAIGRRYLLVNRDDERIGAWYLGRGATCDIVLLDPDLSRTHACVQRDKAGFSIVDLDSKNGTRVDGTPVASARTRPLRDGAQIELGGCVLRFEHRAARHQERLAQGSAALSNDASVNLRTDVEKPPSSHGRTPSSIDWPGQLLAACIAVLAGAAIVAMLW